MVKDALLYKVVSWRYILMWKEVLNAVLEATMWYRSCFYLYGTSASRTGIVILGYEGLLTRKRMKDISVWRVH